MFVFGGADEDEALAGLESVVGTGVKAGALAGEDGDDLATGGFAQAGLGEGFAGESGGGVHADGVDAFGDHEEVTAGNVLEKGAGGERGVGHDEVGPGAVQGGDVALVGGAGDDLEVRAYPPTKYREVNIGVVVVGGDNDGGGASEAGAAHDVEVGGVAEDEEIGGHGPGGDLVDEAVGDVVAREGGGNGAANATGADNDDGGGLGGGSAAVAVVEGGDLGARAGEKQDHASGNNKVG